MKMVYEAILLWTTLSICLGGIATYVIRAITGMLKVPGKVITPRAGMSDLVSGDVLATFQVTCSHMDGDAEVYTHYANHTYVLAHDDRTSMDIRFGTDTATYIELIPKIVLDDDSKKFLGDIRDDLLKRYKDRDDRRTIERTIHITGLRKPHGYVALNDPKHGLTTFAEPISMLMCWMCDRSISVDVVKHVKLKFK